MCTCWRPGQRGLSSWASLFDARGIRTERHASSALWRINAEEGVAEVLPPAINPDTQTTLDALHRAARH